MSGFEFRPVAIGVLLALVALLAGEMHGLAFGAKEDALKAGFKATAQASSTLATEKEKEQASKGAWKYLKRAHMHYMGLGAMAIALCLLVGHAKTRPLHKTIVSTAVGFGAFVYPTFWSLTAFKTAEVGKHAAKEAMEFIALAGAGTGFLGLLGTIAITIMWAMAKDSPKEN